MTKKTAKVVEEIVVPAEEVDTTGKFHHTNSLYRGVVLACQRSKQLIKGATPRTEPEFSHKRKNTRIAVEEVRQGLISFELILDEDPAYRPPSNDIS